MNKIVLNIALWILMSVVLSSCGMGWKELKPVSNDKGLRINLEISKEKSKSEDAGAFSLRVTNNSDSDFKHCTFKFDDKYEQMFEGLKDKTYDEPVVLTRSLLKSGDTFIFIFNSEFDNYKRFGITDAKKNYRPSKIELKTHEGNLIWNVPDDL
jgi:hypothetical protein